MTATIIEHWAGKKRHGRVLTSLAIGEFVNRLESVKVDSSVSTVESKKAPTLACWEITTHVTQSDWGQIMTTYGLLRSTIALRTLGCTAGCGETTPLTLGVEESHVPTKAIQAARCCVCLF